MLVCSDCGIRTVKAAGTRDALIPGVLVKFERYRIREGDDGLLLREVVGLWRRLHLLELCLFLGIGRKSAFIGLVSCRPEGGAKRDGVVFEGGQFDGAIAAAAG